MREISILLQLDLPYLVDIHGKPAFFLKGNRGAVDLGERRLGMGGVERWYAVLRCIVLMKHFFK